jgi:hypothetical protein
MSFIIKIYWSIVDQNGNSLDGQNYDTEDLAIAALAAWTANNTDPSIIGTVASDSKPLVGFN